MNHYKKIADQFKQILGLSTSPVAFYYTDEKPAETISFVGVRRGSCVIALVYQVAKGKIASVDLENHGCPGAGRFLGFTNTIAPNFNEFLSCGIEGVVEGERYLKTPELAGKIIASQNIRPAPAKYAVFEPLDRWSHDFEPELVIFFAPPDIISALAVLSDFDNAREDSNTFVRFGSGCAQIVAWPLQEAKRENPRALLGMFDISARPSVPRDILTFTLSPSLFLTMSGNMGESFLITDSWEKVRPRNLAE